MIKWIIFGIQLSEKVGNYFMNNASVNKIQFKRDKTQNSNKLHLDKYYTPDNIAKYIIDKTHEIIGENNISEYIEPSAGNGVFLKYLPNNTIAYDIEPEGDNIIEQDFLQLELNYKQGRVIIGNPPFGDRNNLARKFCNKSFEIAEYVAFILPISQLNNTQSIYKYDLIHSENLGLVKFTDREKHVCFNVYKKPSNGKFNSKINYKKECDYIKIKEVRNIKGDRRNEIGNFNYDIGICAWGSIGEIAKENQYAKSFFIKILDKNNYDKIYNLILNADWCNIYYMTSTPNLLQWQVYKYINDMM